MNFGITTFIVWCLAAPSIPQGRNLAVELIEQKLSTNKRPLRETLLSNKII